MTTSPADDSPQPAPPGALSARRLRPLWNTIIYTAGNFVPQVANLLLLPVLTRYLSREEYGIFGYTTAIAAFLGLVGNLCIHGYAVRHAFECKTDREKRRLFGTLFVFLAFYSTALLLLELLFMPVLFRRFDVQVPFNPYMRLALYSVVIESLATIPLTYYRTREEAGKFMLLSLTQFVLSMGFSLYLIVWRGTGVLGRYEGQLTANLIMLGVYVIVMLRIAEFSFDRRLVRNAISFSVPIALSGLFGVLTAMFDRLVLERNVALATLGIYSVGFALGQSLGSLSSGIYKALEPTIYRMNGEDGFDLRMATLKDVLVATLAVIGCLAIVFSREVVTLLAAPSFRESYKIMALVSIRGVLAGIAIPASVYVVALKRTKYVAGVDLMGAAVSVTGNLMLVGLFGIYGAAMTGIVAALTIFVGFSLLTERLGAVRWRTSRDLLWMLIALAGATAILQVDLANLVAAIAVKGVLASAFLAAWFTGYLGGPIRVRQLIVGQAT